LGDYLLRPLQWMEKLPSNVARHLVLQAYNSTFWSVN
jgi:hypothetical protein